MKSYRGKTGRRGSFALPLPPPLSWIGLRSVTVKQGWVGFYYLQELRNTYVFYTWHFPIMFYPLDIIYTTCVQNGLFRNDSDISQWTCNLYQLSVWRLYGAFERELIHPEISFCEINFCVYWFLGISRVYRQISENLFESNLSHFPTDANRSQSFCWVCYIA